MKLKMAANTEFASLFFRVHPSVSMRLVYLYLFVCICKTKEHNLRVANGQLSKVKNFGLLFLDS